MKQIIDFKSNLTIICWITGLLLIISVFLIITQSVNEKYLMRTANNIFISREDPRRIIEFTAQNKKNSGGVDLMGYWYNLFNSQDKFFIFTVIQDGILIPLGAVVSNGYVIEVIPLSAHAEQIYDNLPQSILDMYIRRIENSAANMEGVR